MMAMMHEKAAMMYKKGNDAQRQRMMHQKAAMMVRMRKGSNDGNDASKGSNDAQKRQ